MIRIFTRRRRQPAPTCRSASIRVRGSCAASARSCPLRLPCRNCQRCWSTPAWPCRPRRCLRDGRQRRTLKSRPISTRSRNFQTAISFCNFSTRNRTIWKLRPSQSSRSSPTVLTALRGLPGCQLARMSGSGATCFALFSGAAAAREAAKILRGKFPHWWVKATTLN